MQSVWSADDVGGNGFCSADDGPRPARSLASGGRRVALVVGNSAYEHVPALKNPRNDAEDMAAALRDVGFEVIAGTDLDRSAFFERIGQFAERARSAGTAFFFYAGHGMQLDETNYLLPVDAAQRNEWTLKSTAVKLEEVLANMGSGARLVFLDACRDNPFLDGIARARGVRSSAMRRGLKRVEDDAGGMFIAYATAPGDVAADGDGRNSPFTAALKQHMGEPGLEINQVINRVRRTVAATQPAQRPWHTSSLHDDFYFVLPDVRVDPPPGRSDIPDPETETWLQIRETQDVGLLERFLASYPNGRYSLPAQARLEGLRQGTFTVVVRPPEATVRIANIGRYRAGMKLPAGRYRVEASADGYETAAASVSHGTGPTVHRITLDKLGFSALGEPATDGRRAFRDCPECPEMVVLPAGSYRMGSPPGERGRGHVGPVHEVTLGAPFAMGVYEVTFAEWDACARGGGCPRGEGIAEDRGWGRGRRPVINVSWNEAQAYAMWLSRKTGKRYRLPSESEWEYAARAGTATAYSWGAHIGFNLANCDGCGSRWDGVRTAPAGSFAANPWGLHDMHGNVREWTQDCWKDNYRGAPADGSAWESGDCSQRVLRGGSWNYKPSILRAANRFWNPSGNRYYNVGFRVARTLTP